MQISAKIINRSVAWSPLLKPRVGDTVSDNGNYYTNTSGINGPLTDGAHWTKIYSAYSPTPIYKTADDIEGSGTDFYIDLSGDPVPEFPIAKSVYIRIDQDEATPYQPLDPVNYSPETKILSGMNDPAEFPDQVVRITML